VDYGFYLNGQPKFYLEAKKLSVDLHREDYAKQAIRYSWNKGVTWAVLCDFEGLIIFNALSPEKSLAGKKYLSFTYNEYATRFDELWRLSKESFGEDLLDKEAERVGKKLQKISVTETLAKDLSECREILTQAFMQWNGKVDSHLIDEGVQKLLNRLIFIRSAEDRKIEPPTLIPMIHEYKSSGKAGQVSPYQAMIKKFRELDAIYDSNLFDEHPFEKWEEFSGATEKVVDILHGKKNYLEYDFSVIPADVLGNVYENYLGHQLKKSKKEQEPSGKNLKKRKEQGIYYTPKFIVDYIVQNTLGPVLAKCKSITDLQKIKILDPACGSGSFLVVAMNFLLKKYEEFGAKPDGFLKIQILQSNIYGVDLDQQAVELARLNLLLNTFDSKIKLPNLGGNIKNGNSLISGTDEELEKYFGKNYREKIPFNWQEEFSDVFKDGGFDCIVGNPPYVRVDSLGEEDKNFWKKYFISSEGKYDLYYLFIERSIKLLKDSGQLGFIIPNKFCVADSGKKLRKLILESSSIREFFSVSKIDVFKEASNYPVILCLQRGKFGDNTRLSFAEHEEEIIKNSFQKNIMKKQNLDLLPNNIIPVNVDEISLNLVIKLIKRQDKLKDYLKISEGLRIPKKFESQTNENFEIVKQYQFFRYSDIKQGSYISEKNLKTIINTKAERFKNSQKGKILIAEDALFISATIDTNKRIPQGGVYFATSTSENTSLYALLGILNSKLLSFVYKTMFSGMHMGGGYLRYRTTFLNELPVKMSGAKNNIDKLVKLILKLSIELAKAAENSDQWQKIKDEIAKTDKKIDEEVYKLYGLTEEEEKVVNNSL